MGGGGSKQEGDAGAEEVDYAPPPLNFEYGVVKTEPEKSPTVQTKRSGHRRRPSLGSATRTVSGCDDPQVDSSAAIRIGQHRHMSSNKTSASFCVSSDAETLFDKKESSTATWIFYGVVSGFGESSEQLCSFIRLFAKNKLRSYYADVSAATVVDFMNGLFKEIEESMSSGNCGVPNVDKTGATMTVVFYGLGLFVVGSIGDNKCVLIGEEKTESGPVEETPESTSLPDVTYHAIPEAIDEHKGRKIMLVSPDHSWTNESEKKRAAELGASVKRNAIDFVGEVGEVAVWSKADPSSPGLSCSRILGYKSAENCGVLQNWEIYTYDQAKISSRLSYPVIILATAHFWTVMKTKDALAISNKVKPTSRISSFVDAQDLSEYLLETATSKLFSTCIISLFLTHLFLFLCCFLNSRFFFFNSPVV